MYRNRYIMQTITIRQQEGQYWYQKLPDDSDVLSEMRTPSTHSGATVYRGRLPGGGNPWEINWYLSSNEDDGLKVIFPKEKDAVWVSTGYLANYSWGLFQGEVRGTEYWGLRHLQSCQLLMMKGLMCQIHETKHLLWWHVRFWV